MLRCLRKEENDDFAEFGRSGRETLHKVVKVVEMVRKGQEIDHKGRYIEGNGFCCFLLSATASKG